MNSINRSESIFADKVEFNQQDRIYLREGGTGRLAGNACRSSHIKNPVFAMIRRSHRSFIFVFRSRRGAVLNLLHDHWVISH